MIKNEVLNTYWFESQVGLGIGVTAFSLEDAIHLVKNDSTASYLKPDFGKYDEDIKLADLDDNHVIPNMGVMQFRGIWFPNVGPIG
jgi:hypothetical protein